MALPKSCRSTRRGRKYPRWRSTIQYAYLLNSTFPERSLTHLFFLSSFGCYITFIDISLHHPATGNHPLRRGRSLLGREEDVHESGLALFKRGHTMRRKRQQSVPATPTSSVPDAKKKRGCWTGPGPSGPWMIYCLIITILVPSFLLNSCGELSNQFSYYI